MAEVLLYGSIYDETATKFMQDMQAVIDSGDTELVVRINCNGGDVGLGWGLVTKFAEFPGTKKVKIDGKAYSMAAVFPLFADDVETNDLAQGMFHRAASYSEDSEWFKAQGMLAMIDIANAGIKKAMKAKLDIAKLNEVMATKETLAGKKFEDLFSMDGRLNLFIDAKEMKAIGLVNKVVTITPKKRIKINAQVLDCAAFYSGDHSEALLPEATIESPKEVTNENQNIEAMTAADFKLKHPEAYAAMEKEISEASIERERNRVIAWNKFQGVDAKAVEDGIASGKSVMENEAVYNDLVLKFHDPKRSANAEAGTAGTTLTEPTADNAAGADSTAKTEVEKTKDAIFAMASINTDKK